MGHCGHRFNDMKQYFFTQSCGQDQTQIVVLDKEIFNLGANPGGIAGVGWQHQVGEMGPAVELCNQKLSAKEGHCFNQRKSTKSLIMTHHSQS